ncbi:MAG: hypothetical protein FWD78_13025 [Treponema sp.]|nr:hypothetical protein [Treponema sp.]
MSTSVEWKDEKYSEVFEQELRGLERRRSSDPQCSVKDIEGILQQLYLMDGSDWLGRGELQDIIMRATIAAHEFFISQWKGE